MATLTAPSGMPTPTFARFGQAANDCADSRVALGRHFRYATNEGLKLGSRVADYVLGNFLQEAGRGRRARPSKVRNRVAGVRGPGRIRTCDNAVMSGAF
jgi:hypothetical protein